MKTNLQDFRLLPKDRFEDKMKKLETLKSTIDLKHSVTNYYAFLQNPKNGSFKSTFLKTFNNKCCYCGDSFEHGLNFGNVEIDHILSQKVKIDNCIFNLAPACKTCNGGKKDLVISKKEKDLINPYTHLHEVFERNNELYIKIKEPYKNNQFVKEFYNKCKLYSERHRISYLLLIVEELEKKYDDKPKIWANINMVYTFLQRCFNYSFLKKL